MSGILPYITAGTIYVVTSGDYSDYGIEGVFSTRELAQAAIDAVGYRPYGKYDIEEWRLDELVPKAAHSFCVRIAPDGIVKDCRRCDSFPADELVDRDGNLYTEMWADNSEQAMKIANERRTAALLAGRLKPRSQAKET